MSFRKTEVFEVLWARPQALGCGFERFQWFCKFPKGFACRRLFSLHWASAPPSSCVSCVSGAGRIVTKEREALRAVDIWIESELFAHGLKPGSDGKHGLFAYCVALLSRIERALNVGWTVLSLAAVLGCSRICVPGYVCGEYSAFQAGLEKVTV